MGSDDKVFSQDGPLFKFVSFCVDLIDKQLVWVRENIVLPNRQKQYWYHEKVRRVPTIDECYTDDEVCKYEAEQQYKLDRKVEKEMVNILRKRFEYCVFENPHDREDCDPLKEVYEKASVNFFIKYGELGFATSALTCLMKQKNRMAWERRHGPVGSGKKPPAEEYWGKEKKKCD